MAVNAPSYTSRFSKPSVRGDCVSQVGFYPSVGPMYMSGASNVQCEKCGVPRDMGCHDIYRYDDGTTRWKLRCNTCNTVQSAEYDPKTINAW